MLQRRRDRGGQFMNRLLHNGELITSEEFLQLTDDGGGCRSVATHGRWRDSIGVTKGVSRGYSKEEGTSF